MELREHPYACTLGDIPIASTFSGYRKVLRYTPPFRGIAKNRVVADVWEKGVWDFQAKSGSSGSCRSFLHFLRKIAVQKVSGKRLEPSSRHPRPSEKYVKGGGGLRAGIAGQCCPLRLRVLCGGIAAILSQIAVEWVTKDPECLLQGPETSPPTPERSWQVLSRGPSEDRIARSCRHTGPDLTVKTEGER